MRTMISIFLIILALTACMIPGTYYDPHDTYIRGLRFFDRGQPDQAKKDWEPLARAGDCDAQFRLGLLYFLGAGVPQSYDTAREWWFKAANLGQAFAQSLLGVMYAHDVKNVSTIRCVVTVDCRGGCGVEKNMVEAYKWASLSEKFAVYDDHRKAMKELAARYAQQLSADESAEAERAVREWKPSPSQCIQRKIW